MQNLNKEVGGHGRLFDSHNAEDSIASLPAAPDRHNIQIAQKRFEQLSAIRRSRLKRQLQPLQRHFLELLPALLHCNHPVLPGYGPPETPQIIDQFAINTALKKRIEQSFHGFKLHNTRLKKPKILGLYLIGSTGTLAQSNSSDLDCWVCFESPLGTKEHLAITKKCEKISQWAKRFRLDLHFFVMHEDSFRSNRAETTGGEDCGATQHFLLLDEFYRTAIVLAGRMPLWAVIPSRQKNKAAGPLDYDNSKATNKDSYNDFVKKISDEKFIRREHFIDFGDTGDIPVTEYLSASVWTLYKAIQSPFKAVIKLMLLETYIYNHKNQINLSDELKNLLHQDNLAIEKLDPYLQIYHRIEKYFLATEQRARLELLRHCFYRKVGIKISRTRALLESSRENLHGISWREKLMFDLVSQWQWSDEKMCSLDHADSLNWQQILQERNQITGELLSTYRRIDNLARIELNQKEYSSHRDSNELKLLEKHLKVIYRYSPFKVGYKLSEKDARLRSTALTQIGLSPAIDGSRETDSTAWELQRPTTLPAVQGASTGNSSERRPPLFSASSADAIMLWCLQQGMANQSTNFRYAESDSESSVKKVATLKDINGLLNRIANHVKNFYYGITSSEKAIRHLDNGYQVTRCLVLINSQSSSRAESLWDQVVLTEKDDPLAYTGRPRNQVKSLSLLWSNCWGEIFHHTFSGHDAIQRALKFYLTLDTSHCCETTFECASTQRPRALSRRIEQLFNDVIEWNNDWQNIDDSTTDQLPPAFAFLTADGIYLVESLEKTPNNRLSQLGDRFSSQLTNRPQSLCWSIDGHIGEVRQKIETQWNVRFDALSFRALHRPNTSDRTI